MAGTRMTCPVNVRTAQVARRVVAAGSSRAERVVTPQASAPPPDDGADLAPCSPVDPTAPFSSLPGFLSARDVRSLAEAWDCGRWLLGLLVLQSSSSLVLEKYEDLVRDHLVITLFLTMLVGAGGNAGNQSAIKIIRGLATGRYKPR